MHELLAAIMGEGATPTSIPADNNSLKIAVITAISVVLAAAITAFATTIHSRRDSAQADTAQDLIAELLRRAEVAERRSGTVERRNESLTKRVDELEGFCWRNGVDPETGEPVPRQPKHSAGEDSNG